MTSCGTCDDSRKRLTGLRPLRLPRAALLIAALLLALLAPAAAVRADVFPTRPLTFFGDRLVIGGDLTFTFGSDDSRYFNTLDYDHNALNVSRIGIAAEFRPTDRVAIVTQVVDEVALRSEPFDFDRNVFRVYALFLRVRPWGDKAFDVQAGRIPPVFGAFARQDYGAGNPLIGLPFAYQYPTTLRADALPAKTTDLLQQRGRGWWSSLPIGAQSNAEGLPIISPQRWDTGVQAHWGDSNGPIEISGAVTQGTLSNPRIRDDNGGKQVSGRVSVRPTAGLMLGASASRGAFISDRALDLVPAADRQDHSFTQRAFGVDAEYSRGYWLVRAETIVSLWRVPAIDAPLLDDPLRAWATSVEGRYKFSPRWYLAGRFDRMTFSEIEREVGGRLAWDAPVTRVEVGGGYAITRNVRVKASYQHDWRDSARFNKADLVGVQLAYWF
jgi:hypothetical protein